MPAAALAAEAAALQGFITENKLDPQTEETLRKQPIQVRQKVLSGGPVIGEDKRAVVLERIRMAEEAANEANGSNGAIVPAKPLADGAKSLPPKAAGAPAPSAGQGVGSAWGDPVSSARDEGRYPPMPFGAHPMPGLPPPGPWPMQPDPRIDWFCRQYGVDAGAERVLRKLHPAAQRRILDEGPVGGPGANPSLQLMDRIHRLEAWEHGHHVAAFLARSFVSPQAQDALRALPLDGQKQVLAYGPLLSPDPSGELISRCQSARASGAGRRTRSDGPLALTDGRTSRSRSKRRRRK